MRKAWIKEAHYPKQTTLNHTTWCYEHVWLLVEPHQSSLSIESWNKQNKRLDCNHVSRLLTAGQWPKHSAEATAKFFRPVAWNAPGCPSQSPEINPAIHWLMTQLKTRGLWNKQELKTGLWFTQFIRCKIVRKRKRARAQFPSGGWFAGTLLIKYSLLLSAWVRGQAATRCLPCWRVQLFELIARKEDFNSSRRISSLGTFFFFFFMKGNDRKHHPNQMLSKQLTLTLCMHTLFLLAHQMKWVEHISPYLVPNYLTGSLKHYRGTEDNTVLAQYLQHLMHTLTRFTLICIPEASLNVQRN